MELAFLMEEYDPPLIAVYVVTYRRHAMLRRALDSVRRQTYKNIVVKVVNDDPEDAEVGRIVVGLADDRFSLFTPQLKRGATRNLNLAFAQPNAPYVTILEDDNWWEPTFLEEMYTALASHPELAVAVGNERIWKECEDGSWTSTGATVWTAQHGVQVHQYEIEQICGSAKICNSSMLVRLGDSSYRTPDDIPVDVTEHFRERLFPNRILLVGTSLVNYAETVQTARSVGGSLWGEYQALLICSVFIALPHESGRQELADRLWRSCDSSTS